MAATSPSAPPSAAADKMPENVKGTWYACDVQDDCFHVTLDITDRGVTYVGKGSCSSDSWNIVAAELDGARVTARLREIGATDGRFDDSMTIVASGQGLRVSHGGNRFVSGTYTTADCQPAKK
jgi:hypothetical protein